MGHMKRVLVLVVIMAFGVLSWVGIAYGVRYVIRTTTEEPHCSMIDKDTVLVRFQQRAYTARYEGSKKVFEVLEDHRFGRSCRPRVEVGNVFVLDYRCDENGHTDKSPADMAKTVEDLASPIVEDFNRFRPMADVCYAEAVAKAKAKVAEAR